MSAFLNKVPRLVQNLQNNSVLQQSKRYRGKINIQKPREPHYEKARLLKLTEAYFPSKKKNLPLIELCDNLKPKLDRTKVENPFQLILAKECLNWFNHSRLVVLFHFNPMTADERFNAFVAFKKCNMHLNVYGVQTLKLALSGTKYEAFTRNYVSQNIILFSPEPDIKQVLKINKKFPQLILLSAIFEGKFINKDELLKYSQITNIQIARAQFVQTLQNIGGQFVQRLNQQQNNLISHLKSRADQLKGLEDS